MKLEGIFVPNVTPFDERGEIQYESLADLIEFWLEAGVSGLVVNASTGEGPLISRGEKRGLIEFVREKVDGRGMVVAGTGAIGTRETIDLTRDAKELGADAALVTTPFFFKPTEEELVEHFTALDAAVDLPFILYNVPKFTGYTVAPSIVNKISECANMAGIKDSSGSPGAMAENIRLFGDRVSVLSGAADMTLPTLSMGGKGAILAVANFIPEVCVGLYGAAKRGDLVEAGGYQQQVSYVNKVLVREHPQVAAVKAALSLKGHPAGVPRGLLKPLGEDGVKSVHGSLREGGLLPDP